MKDLKLVIIGMIIGIGKIIPGVSGAMFAMIFGVYEKSLNIISNLRTELKKNFKFIFLLGSGIIISIFFGSKIIKYFITNHYLSTMMLFIGMMVAGIKPLFSEIKNEKFKICNLLIALIVVSLLFISSRISSDNITYTFSKSPITFFVLVFTGFLDAMGTVIPGVCGTALLMIIGYYDIVLNSLSSIFDFALLNNNLFVIIPFIFGMLIGIVVISKIVNYLFNNHRVKTYYSIIGFAITSVIILFFKVLSFRYCLKEILLSIILFIIGYIISYLFDKVGV